MKTTNSGYAAEAVTRDYAVKSPSQLVTKALKTLFSCVLNVCYLVIVHGDIEFIVQLESQAPHDSSEPQTIVGVHRLCLCCDIQDVLSLVQWTHILTCTNTHTHAFVAFYTVYVEVDI